MAYPHRSSCFSKSPEKVGDCGLMNPTARGETAVRVVGREQAAVYRAQRAAGRERLDLEDVERCAGDPPLAQSLNKRRLVNQLASRRVDEIRRGPHNRQLVAPYQAPGGRIEIAMERDEVGLLEQCSQGDEAQAGLGDKRRGWRGRVGPE